MPHMLVNPSTRTPQKRAGSDAACRHGFDMGPHGGSTWLPVVEPGQVVAPRRHRWIAQRIRTPRCARGAHTRSSCSRMWACSRHTQRQTTGCGNPGPGRVDHSPLATVACATTPHLGTGQRLRSTSHQSYPGEPLPAPPTSDHRSQRFKDGSSRWGETPPEALKPAEEVSSS